MLHETDARLALKGTVFDLRAFLRSTGVRCAEFIVRNTGVSDTASFTSEGDGSNSKTIEADTSVCRIIVVGSLRTDFGQQLEIVIRSTIGNRNCPPYA